MRFRILRANEKPLIDKPDPDQNNAEANEEDLDHHEHDHSGRPKPEIPVFEQSASDKERDTGLLVPPI